MKIHYTLVAGLFLTTTLIAQTNMPPAPAPAAPAAVNPAAPATPPAATPKKAATKHSSKTPAPKHSTIVEKPVSLVPGPAVVDARNVNIRGRSTILSEALTRVTKGDTVTVLEQVENRWAKGDDMKQWARIAYPSNAQVWVFASMVDAGKTVTVPKLNLRGGPGENFSIVGRLAKGDTVKEISTKGEWMRIEPPASATAFIAAMYLRQDAAMVAAAAPVTAAPPVVPASTNVITDVAPAIAATVDTASTNAASSELNSFAASLGGTNAPAVESDEPPAPRVVMREGIVSGNTSIQAPSYYSLLGMDSGRTINYLHTTSPNVHLGRYMGRHIIVTGEESLDPRWPNTPVLTLQRIQVIDEKE